MIDLVTPMDFDKLTDDVLYLGNKMILRLNVILAKMNEKTKTRIYHHKEYIYDSKYADKHSVGTIRRSFQYYLSIDKTDMYESNIMIRPQDMMLIRSKLPIVASWFSNGVFATKNNIMIIQSRPEPVIIDGLLGGKFMMFEPIVLEYEDSKIQEQGVRMTISRNDTYVDMTIDKFYGLYYTFNSLNMFMSAQLLVNYLGRPELGQNLCDYSGITDDFYEPQLGSIKCKERTIKNNNKSFFDKIDEMGNTL